ncbi:MAG: maleylacetoacetate isomerase [marine bacterium B5-7]|nr:MAG: maleylacetoacetate isomerase [marine bacterium B5-7]
MRILYDYWRSTAAYRVRIALNLKGLDYQHVAVHLTRDGGQQKMPEYTGINPQKLVPTLVDGDVRIGQSIAILEYLEESYPEIPILPCDPANRARARQAALAIACDIHPLNNLRVLGFLTRDMGIDEAGKLKWYHHWILENFPALEAWAKDDADKGPYFLGEQVTIADICLVPQMFNARRFDVPLDDFPRLVEIDQALNAIDAFSRAAPANQPDAE